MIQITPQMWIWVALDPVDFRKGIDGLAALCRHQLQADPMDGAVFVFGARVQCSGR
jgi:transposase